jgi:hypothetical protein
MQRYFSARYPAHSPRPARAGLGFSAAVKLTELRVYSLP